MDGTLRSLAENVYGCINHVRNWKNSKYTPLRTSLYATRGRNGPVLAKRLSRTRGARQIARAIQRNMAIVTVDPVNTAAVFYSCGLQV